MIKLYGVSQSRALRSLWMLEELGLPYENVKTNFRTGDTRKPDFLRLNPNGHIPVLQDGDVTLWESMAINLYLARRYDKGLWPKSVADEGRAFQWSLWAMTEAEEPIITALLHRMSLPDEQRDAKKADDAVERFKKPLAVLDVRLRGDSGLNLQDELRRRNATLPIIVMTGYADVPTSVRALKGGAIDFLRKPVPPKQLIARIREAIDVDRRTRDAGAQRAAVADRIAQLTPREREVMELLAVGNSSKAIAVALRISVRTVESHRRTVLRKLGVSSAAQLARAVARSQLP